MKIICGIYKIEDVKTGNVYVGHAEDIKKRFSCHIGKLKGNYHEYNELQEAFNKDNNRIKFEILEECAENELSDREKYWIGYCKKVDGWIVINKDPNRTTRKSKVKDTRLMCASQTGENNGHCTKLSKQSVFEILNMLQDGVNRKIIAAKFDIYPAYVSRIGKDRWVKAYKEWQKQKETVTSANVQSRNGATAIA